MLNNFRHHFKILTPSPVLLTKYRPCHVTYQNNSVPSFTLWFPVSCFFVCCFFFFFYSLKLIILVNDHYSAPFFCSSSNSSLVDCFRRSLAVCSQGLSLLLDLRRRTWQGAACLYKIPAATEVLSWSAVI